MQNIIALEVLAAVSENGFSLDELVISTRKLFEQEGMPGLIGLILHLLDENISLRLRQNNSGWKPPGCCAQPDYEFQDQQEKTFRTSAGKVKIRWRRLRCRRCGKSTIPLREFLGLEAYQSKTAELEKTVVEVVSEQSYRRSSSHLETIGNEHQRCSWHFIHDLNFSMWQDGASKTERDAKQNELINIIGIELPEEDFKSVSQQEHEEISAKLDKAKNDMEQLYNYLMSRGYDEAAGYINRGGKNIFTYLERWLKTGLITPRVSSMIERMMREIARRLKRIAFGWSPAGAAKMARIIIKRFTSAAQWEKYWKDRLKIDGKVIMLLRDVKLVSPQPLGR